MTTTKSIGNKIAEARKKTRLSQADLAQQLFISPQAVGKWERGESMPDITTFIRLSEVFGVDLNYFSPSLESVGIEIYDEHQSDFNHSSIAQEKKERWDMSSGNWADADFSGLKNLHEKFSSSNLKNCLFIEAEMMGIVLKNNHVEACDFSNSDISKSQIHNSNLVNNKFDACNLQTTVFSGNRIKMCDFSASNFTKSVFKSCSISKSTWLNAILNQTSFNGSAFSDLVFEGILEDCSFENCGFSKVKFQNTTLLNTFFKNNKGLKKVTFVNCKVDKITFAFLQNGKANLTGLRLIND